MTLDEQMNDSDYHNSRAIDEDDMDEREDGEDMDNSQPREYNHDEVARLAQHD
jgi:hypothetical protein